MKHIKGNPVSRGIAVAPVFLFNSTVVKVEQVEIEDPDREWKRLQDAIREARRQIREIRGIAESRAGEEEAFIFEAHEMFLNDPALLDAVKKRLQTEQINVEAAWQHSIRSFADELSQSEEKYFQERAKDVHDVGQRVLRILSGQEGQTFQNLLEPSIIVARDLTPSDTVQLDKEHVRGFCTAEGGPTSHTSILARTLGLPAVVGLGEEILNISPGTRVAMDGRSGEVVVAPDEEIVEKFENKGVREDESAKPRLENAHKPAITSDGKRIRVLANIGRLDDIEAVLAYGAEGIGLLRTEFLYLDREKEPDEKSQLAVYEEIFGKMGDLPVTVRTLDIGGDKPVPYMDLPEEENPYLGWRAIRISLEKPELFKNQLRALLQAGENHQVSIMFPMIVSLSELRAASGLLEEARLEVTDKRGQPLGGLPLGMMVETPAAVLMVDQFVKEVSFLSIGTNDLVQYTMAAERGNQKLTALSDPCHPAILRQIKRVVDTAEQENVKVSVCGEMAADPDAIPFLLGLGITELSMAPTIIPLAKEIIRNWTIKDAREVADQALLVESAEDVRKLVRDH